RDLDLHLAAGDVDPIDPFNPNVGGPTGTTTLRWTVAIAGKTVTGSDTTITIGTQTSPDFSFTVPLAIAEPNASTHVELCDCVSCEAVPGSGRCASYEIPIVIPDVSTAVLATLVEASAAPDRVTLRWRLATIGTARIERRDAFSGWQDRGEVPIDS